MSFRLDGWEELLRDTQATAREPSLPIERMDERFRTIFRGLGDPTL